MKQESKESYKFKQDLEEFLKKRDKLVILGIGNQLRGDDFSGSLVARKLNQILENEQITIIDGETVPENFTGQIKKENPSHIILIDAADMGKTPGYVKLIKKDEIAQYNISTHAMPLSFLIKYLKHTTDARIILIGIQPKEMRLEEKVSHQVYQSISFLIELFYEIFEKGPKSI
jgi:hydrogenase 3 maturation protease